MVKTISSDYSIQVGFILSCVFQIYCKAKTIHNHSGNTFSSELSVFDSKLHTDLDQVALLCYPWLQTAVVGQKA